MTVSTLRDLLARLHGVKEEVYPEGTHLMVSPFSETCRGGVDTFGSSQIPWFETPIVYDIRAKPRNIASLTGTKGAFDNEPTRYLRLSFSPPNFSRLADGQHYVPSTFAT